MPTLVRPVQLCTLARNTPCQSERLITFGQLTGRVHGLLENSRSIDNVARDEGTSNVVFCAPHRDSDNSPESTKNKVPLYWH